MHAAINGTKNAIMRYGIYIFSIDFFSTTVQYTEKMIMVVQIIDERSNVTLSTP